MTLEDYTEERFRKELSEIRGTSGGCINSSIEASKRFNGLVVTNYDSSYVGGCISYCNKCDKLTIKHGPDAVPSCKVCGYWDNIYEHMGFSTIDGKFFGWYSKNDFTKIVDKVFNQYDCTFNSIKSDLKEEIN